MKCFSLSRLRCDWRLKFVKFILTFLNKEKIQAWNEGLIASLFDNFYRLCFAWRQIPVLVLEFFGKSDIFLGVSYAALSSPYETDIFFKLLWILYIINEPEKCINGEFCLLALPQFFLSALF